LAFVVGWFGLVWFGSCDLLVCCFVVMWVGMFFGWLVLFGFCLWLVWFVLAHVIRWFVVSLICWLVYWLFV